MFYFQNLGVEGFDNLHDGHSSSSSSFIYCFSYKVAWLFLFVLMLVIETCQKDFRDGGRFVEFLTKLDYLSTPIFEQQGCCNKITML